MNASFSAFSSRVSIQHCMNDDVPWSSTHLAAESALSYSSRHHVSYESRRYSGPGPRDVSTNLHLHVIILHIAGSKFW